MVPPEQRGIRRSRAIAADTDTTSPRL